MNPFGVYVHIPFCSKRCDYCAFATWTDRSHLMQSYADACRKEIVSAQLPAASSVFFGGGTPSLLPTAMLTSILSEINVQPGAEVTVECNPDNLTPEKLEAFAAAGVNRISMGVQSMVPHVLEGLGRVHDVGQVRAASAMVCNAGIDRFNVDLIYGVAGESLDDWRKTVDAVLSLDPRPQHVSAYALTVEAGTPLARDVDRHPDDDVQAQMYTVADDAFTAAGLINYEISNWSEPGEECRHNLLYWRQHDYRGVGCAAHSHSSGRRWWNLRTPERYVQAVENGTSVVAAGEDLDESTRRWEGLELALRTTSGVPADVLPVEDLSEFLIVTDGRAVLNRRGRLMANEIAMHLRA